MSSTYLKYMADLNISENSFLHNTLVKTRRDGVVITKPNPVMQIVHFSANFDDFVAKKLIFVNRLYPSRQFRGHGRELGVHNALYRLFIQN